MIRPSASEIDLFLSQYNFEPDAIIEQFDIGQNDNFQFLMFAAYEATKDEISLFVHWPDNKEAPTSEMT